MSKENLFSSDNTPEIHVFNTWRHQKLLLVANQLQDSTFLFEFIEDNGISKSVSHLKLLLSLFELNDTIDMSPITKKLQEKWSRKVKPQMLKVRASFLLWSA